MINNQKTIGSGLQPSIAVAGCGYWGKNLVRNLAELGMLKAVCDANLATLDLFRQKYGVEGVQNFEDILDRKDIRAVVIATPAHTHASLAKQALLKDKDVFVEKPLALAIKDAEEIKAIAAQHSKIVMVGHLLEYHPALISLRNLLEAGKIGKPQYLYSNRLSTGKVRTEENVLWSFAPHDICSIIGCVGRLPVAVQAAGSTHIKSVQDACTINLAFENNIKAHIFVSWHHPFKEQRLVVTGSAGSLVFDDVSADQKLTFYEQPIEADGEVPIIRKANQSSITISSAEPLKSECQHFIHCVQTRQPPKTDIRNGIDVLAVLQAAQASLDSGGKTVTMKELEYV